MHTLTEKQKIAAVSYPGFREFMARMLRMEISLLTGSEAAVRFYTPRDSKGAVTSWMKGFHPLCSSDADDDNVWELWTKLTTFAIEESELFDSLDLDVTRAAPMLWYVHGHFDDKWWPDEFFSFRHEVREKLKEITFKDPHEVPFMPSIGVRNNSAFSNVIPMHKARER